MSKRTIANTIAALPSAKHKTDTRIVLINWDAIQAIAELCGCTIERDKDNSIKTITVRGNRSEQVTTKKLVQILSEPGQPLWDCHVAHIYISTKDGTPNIVEGGNTFRGFYRYFDANQDANPVPCTISVSDTLSWENWDQLKKPKDNETLLGMRFDDGHEELYSSLFSFSCLRVKGKSIKGGQQDGRTWRGKVWLPSQLPTMFEDSWFANLWNMAIYQNADKQSLLSLGTTLQTLVKRFGDNSIGLVIMAWVDYFGSLSIVDEDDSTQAMDDGIKAISDNLENIANQLNAIYNPPKGLATYNIEAKYAAIYELVAASIEGRQLPDVFECDTVIPLGCAQAFEEFKA